MTPFYMEWKIYYTANCIFSSGSVQFVITGNTTLLIKAINKPTKHMGVFSL